MEPIYKALEMVRARKVFAKIKEQEQQKEKEETRRKEKREAHFNRLREEEDERNRKLETEQRQANRERIRISTYSRKIPYLVHFTPINNVNPILEFGLLSRNALTTSEFIFTDT